MRYQKAQFREQQFHSMNRYYRQNLPQSSQQHLFLGKLKQNDYKKTQTKQQKSYQYNNYDQLSNQSTNQINKPFLLKRIIYVMIFFAFMLILSFYFDLLENYDFLSLLLGFVACIIFQVKILQIIFKKQMTKMQIDQFGAIRAKIKYWFGQMDHKYLQQKNRRKYYHHTLSQEDKLFEKQNKQIYNNSMQYLISQSKVNHLEKIQKIHRRWQLIITKYDIMKKFVKSLMEIYIARSNAYSSFHDRIHKRINKNDYAEWNTIFKIVKIDGQPQNTNQSEGVYNFFTKLTTNFTPDNQNINSINKQNDLFDQSMSQEGFSVIQNPINLVNLKKQIMNIKLQPSKDQYKKFNGISWKQFMDILQERHKINNKKIKYMKKSVSDQLNLNLQAMRNQRQKSIKQLQSLRSSYQSNIKSKQQILNQINKLKQKINELSETINTKHRTTKNHQQICKVQLDIRMKKVEIQNLQVKLNLSDDLTKKSSFELYTKCLKTNTYLQGRCLQIYNNKLWNYLKQLLQDEATFSLIVFNKYSSLSNNQQSLRQSNINPLQQQIMSDLERQTHLAQLSKSHEQYDCIEMFQAYETRQNNQQNIKFFFNQLLQFYHSLQQNITQTISTIDNIQKQLFQKLNAQTFGQKARKSNYSDQSQDQVPLGSNYASNFLYDKYFLEILISLSKKDQKVTNSALKVVQNQRLLILQYIDKYAQRTTSKISQLKAYYRNSDEQLKKLQKSKSKFSNIDQFQSRKQQIHEKINKIKKQIWDQLITSRRFMIPSKINILMRQIFQKQFKIYQYILAHEKKSVSFQAKSQNQQQQSRRILAFKQYQSYSLKVYTYNFDQPLYESLARSSQNRTQIKRRPLIEQKKSTTIGKDKQNEILLKQKRCQSKEESLKMVNRLIGVFFEEWSNSQFFHQLIKQQLQISLNFKRPRLVEPLHIEYLKIQQKTKQSGFQDISPIQTQISRCLFDVKINFKGKIAVNIKTRLNFGNRMPLNINLLIKQFVCPLRICFTPFSIGKSYVSLLERPFLNIQYDVKIGQWHINRIPFFSRLIKLFIVLKMRKKILWPKKITLSIPLAYKNPLKLAIRQRSLFESQTIKRKMK